MGETDPKAAHWSLVTFELDGRDRAGVLLSDGEVVSGPPLDRYDGLYSALQDWATLSDELRSWDPESSDRQSGATIVAPLRYPRKLICAGANYGSHLEEMGVAVPGDGPPEPFFFLKPASSTVIGPGEVVRIPEDPRAQVDWEAELGLVIGRRASRITPQEARSHIAGYTILNDISARGFHRREDALAPPFGFDWLGSKGRDTFCPMGPGITPSWMVDDPGDLSIRLEVNGETKQEGRTSDMLVGCQDLVSAASRTMTLEPGDVIATGTPSGVGVPRGEFLAGGDQVEIEISGLGTLANPIEVI